jgi:hypothetical protein
MVTVLIAWLVSAVVILGLAKWLARVLNRSILIDSRGRYSLTHFQVIVWTVVVIALIMAMSAARLSAGLADGLGFAVPEQLLIAMGISLGAGATATAIKAGKNDTEPARIAASNNDDRPRFAQVFLLEEGDQADKVVDVTKFQNFLLGLVVVIGYVALMINTNWGHEVKDVTLPSFSGTLLTLLGISHAGYLAGKLPDQSGTPSGLTLDLKRNGATPGTAIAVSGSPSTYVPRNPAKP